MRKDSFGDILKNSVVGQISKYTLTIISVYFVTYFVYRDFNVRMFWGYLVLSVLLLVTFLEVIFVKKKITIPYIKFLFLIFILISIFLQITPNGHKDKGTLAYIFLSSLLFGFTLLAQENEKDIQLSFKLIYIFGLAFGLFILFFELFPRQYYKYIFPFLSLDAQRYIENLTYSGYSISIGGITNTLYIISFSFFSTLSYMLYFKPTGKKKRLASISLLLFFFVILMSGRRGELLAIILTLLLFFLTSASKEKRRIRVRNLIVFTLILTLMLFILYPYLRDVPFLVRHIRTIERIFDGTDLNELTSGRIVLYEKAWRLFKQQPLLGIGNGQIPYVSSHGNFFLSSRGLDTHNIILQVLAENGLIGLFLYMTPYLLIYLNTLQFNLKIADIEYKDKVGTAVFSNAISFQLQSFLLITAMVDPINYKLIFWVMLYIVFYLQVYSDKAFNFSQKHLTIDLKTRKIYKSHTE